MRGLAFKCWRGNDYMPLSELLLALGHRILRLRWRVKVVELAPDPRAAALSAVDPARFIDTVDLLHIVTPRVQVIDGEFRAYDQNECIRVIVRAVDSTWWDVETVDSSILLLVRELFPDAIELPEERVHPAVQ